ncbi:Hsp90 protein [SAR86 cluster bacterium SAR86E]|jgi:molecular chaperone HtpG|uniref:Chaperone protein HtpG n=1 Tax=SAR86 cluster bacterium SAR86E TaxID=1208365 RepID=K6G778_9GAMM|nr:Hsp90 protein [SAR86 cluster bacterium SAR86E]
MARSKTKSFQTETKQLLQLMIHSLYSNKEIFLRELVSNSSDALDKLRFNAIEDNKLLEGDAELKININLNSQNNTVTISDNGIGMTEEEIIENIGTIAKSGTAQFLSEMTGDKKKDSNLIGQFGVGFYSVFMVAEKVSVHSRSALAKAEDAVMWESSGEDTYQLSNIPKEDRGTKITIHLNEDNKEFSELMRVKFLLQKYSQYINFPLILNPEEGESETINDSEAIWLKSKRSVKDDEYKEFYKFISYDSNDPLKWIHNKVEGKQEYSSLLFIPEKSPYDLWNRDTPRGIKLFIQRVFIMDDAAHFLPLYLRFIKGVVDSSDLPLNVSREILQDHPLVDSIKKGLTKRVLDTLKKMQKDQPEDYQTFWKEFGLVIKEGPAEDYENAESIAELFLFASTANDGSNVETTLDQYIERMNADDEKIYYSIADTYEAAANSPHIEHLKANDTEVLILTDRIDEWLMTTLMQYKGKSLINIAKEELDESAKKPRVTKEKQEVIDKMKKSLDSRVSDVIPSSRLVDSAACLVLSKDEPGAQLKRILEASGQTFEESKPVFEVNLKHKLIKKLSSMSGKEFTNFSQFLFDYAVIAEGGSPKDPAKYLRQLDKYLG